MTKMGKPTKPCYICGSNAWWQRPDGGWSCGRCHPNPNPGSNPVSPINEGRYPPKVLALRDRVILGNQKLNDAWEQIKGMVHDSEEWNYQMECWHQANEKLSLLCTELQAKGYEDCLYLDDQGGKTIKCLRSDIGCRVCPSRIPYWEQELLELPGPKSPSGKPNHPCYTCGSNDWWLTPDGWWLCGLCHPQPREIS